MKHLSVMMKPASSACNMRCRYCFYCDIAQTREQSSYGMMSDDVLEAVVRRTLESAQESCDFVFQGGEPTLAGLEFYQKLIGLEEQYNRRGIRISHALQTNGMLLDEEWAAFLKKNHFLVGLSLDGAKEIHDELRVDARGRGTFQRVCHASQILDRYGVDYNILTVVTRFAAKRAASIYRQYTQKYGWKYMQFLPCLDPYGMERGSTPYSLSPNAYGRFLKDLFDVWYQDLKRGSYVYIRYFENLVGILMGIQPESCGLMGGCHAQLVVESDGGCYPCDFYVTESRCMGSFLENSMEELLSSPSALQFQVESFPPPQECLTCQWKALCRGGCRRDRDEQGQVGSNYFCQAYQMFFEYAQDRFHDIICIYQGGKTKKER